MMIMIMMMMRMRMMMTRCMSAVNGRWPTAVARLISPQQFLISYLQRSRRSLRFGAHCFCLSFEWHRRRHLHRHRLLLVICSSAELDETMIKHSLADLLAVLPAGPAAAGSREVLWHWDWAVRPIVCILRYVLAFLGRNFILFLSYILLLFRIFLWAAFLCWLFTNFFLRFSRFFVVFLCVLFPRLFPLFFILFSFVASQGRGVWGKVERKL